MACGKSLVERMGDRKMRLSLGITGHRDTNLAYHDNAAGIAAALNQLFDASDGGSAERAKPRLHALLALGAEAHGFLSAMASRASPSALSQCGAANPSR